MKPSFSLGTGFGSTAERQERFCRDYRSRTSSRLPSASRFRREEIAVVLAIANVVLLRTLTPLKRSKDDESEE